MWAALGLALLWRRDAHRLPHATASRSFIWTCLGARDRSRWSPCCFSPPVNNARRWFGVGGLGMQPSELAKLVRDLLHRRAARAAHAPHQRRRLRAAADRHRRRSAWSALILLEPDFGTSMSLVLIAAVDGVRRRPELPLHRRRARSRALPAVVHRRDGRRVPPAPACWRSSIRGTTRSATASRSSSR